MKSAVRQEILTVLRESIDALKQGDTKLLKELSNRTIHSTTIYQSEEPMLIAILIYAISKVYERSKYHGYPDWKYIDTTIRENLNEAESRLKKGDIEGYKTALKNIMKRLVKTESKLKYYISDIIEKTKIAKASRIYEHGLSMGLVSELFGINLWELAEYTGKTGISDISEGLTESVKRRLKIARRIFA